MDNVKVSPEQIGEICVKVMPQGISVGVQGEPGTAKSATGKALAARFAEITGESWNTIMFNCAYHEPTDVVGLPFVRDGRAHMAVTDLWPTTPNNIIVVEEVTKGPKLIQNALGELIHERKLRGYDLPENTYFYLSWNRRGDGAGDQGILSHIANRLLILNMKVDPQGTIDYGISNRWNPMVLGFLNQNQHMVFDSRVFQGENGRYNPDKPSFPSPRSWEKAQEIVSLGFPGDLEIPALCGVIGEGATREFAAYKKLCEEIPDIKECIRQPSKAPVPTELSVMYALTLSLVYATKPTNLAQICEYMLRLRKDFVLLYAKNLSKIERGCFLALTSEGKEVPPSQKDLWKTVSALMS